MTFRPAPALWFELVTTKPHVAAALAALALTGAAELETRADATHAMLLPDLEELLKAQRAIAKRYESHWPAPRAVHRNGDPRALLEEDWRRIVAWRAEADPLIVQVEKLAQEKLDLLELSEALAAAGDAFPAPEQLVRAGPRLAARILSLPPVCRLSREVRGSLLLRWQTPDASYHLVVGPAGEVGELASQALSMKGHAIPLPAWLPAAPSEAREAVARRRAECSAAIGALRGEISDLARKNELAEALGDFVLFEWMQKHVADLAGSARLVYITGWTAAQSEGDLERAMGDAAPCLVRFPPAPAGAHPPLILRNPAWAAPFEMFTRMLGMPGGHEADPSVALAIITPLLFGFMFGDVGQGLVLIIGGLVFARRAPVLRLLAPGGVVAMVFGALFGSIFCFEALPALWLRPLEHPVTVLAVAIAFGAALLTFGLLINAMQAAWRGASLHWWACEAGLAAAYLSTIAAAFWRPALWGAPLGALWFIFGAAALAPARMMGAAAAAAAEFVEKLLQLLVNTLSFARVGAFALAHAGLSAAVVSLAHTAGDFGFLPVIVAGNALILALEGLVVGIQTTRLMLFEFFIRFLEGGGRALNPLQPPRDWRPISPASLQTREM